MLIEFSDYQCPFCRRHFQQTFPAIERDYVQTGKLRYVFHNLPIPSLHPDASRGAEAAVCAQGQGKCWEMHQRLFDDPRDMARATLIGHARELGLNHTAFERCLSTDGAIAVQKQLAFADALQLSATPAFMLGDVLPDGSVQVKKRIQGAQPYSEFTSFEPVQGRPAASPLGVAASMRL